MIDAKELRLGNIIKDDSDLWTHVSSISDGQTMITCRYETGSRYSRSYFPQQLSGVELTPSILEKCGFAKAKVIESKIENGWEGNKWENVSENIDSCWHNDDIIIRNNNGYWQLVEIGACYDESTGLHVNYNCKIKHLHQLQNLIYCLTGHELEIKL